MLQDDPKADGAMTVRILQGDCREVLKTLPDESVQCCITSPPYFGLRDYGTATWEGGDPSCDHKIIDDGGPKQLSNRGATGHVHRDCPKCGARRVDKQLGLEATPDEYVANLVGVFREVRRVLRKDGTCWVVLGDSYASGKGTCFNPGGGEHSLGAEKKKAGAYPLDRGSVVTLRENGLKPKDLIGIPWRMALALQADGWWIRSEITWIKRAPMPESVRDRPTSATEKVFLLTKSAKYFYDAEAVKQPITESTKARISQKTLGQQTGGEKDYSNGTNMSRSARKALENFAEHALNGRNMRNYLFLGPEPFKGAHFATFPTALVRPCILAGTSERGCCPVCGAPWERVVERGERVVCGHGASRKAAEMLVEHRGESSLVGSTMADGMSYSKRTAGWRPTCDCLRPEEDRYYWCPDCDIICHISELSSGCPKCGETMIPAPYDPVPCVALDPFGGAGTVGVVAKELGRDAVLIELNSEYVEMARQRIDNAQAALRVEAN